VLYRLYVWDNVRGYGGGGGGKRRRKKERKKDAENRQFQDNWTEDYYLILIKGLPVCLLSNESVSVNKVYN
jgi:hypothetical protein